MKTDFIDTVGAFVPGGRFTIPGSVAGPLAGLTFAVKDLFDIAGRPTGAGNPTWLATHPVPRMSSPLVDRLLAAGATLVGKTITDELAYSLHGDNIHYGAPINAHARDRVTGGSSSGSAAAVAARLVDFALGTDTGGSTRVPASYCGIWGLRPTHGALSTQGLVPLHPSYDTPTWFAHDPVTFVKVAEVLLPARRFIPVRVLSFTDANALADEDFAKPLRDALRVLELMIAPARPLKVAGTTGLDQWRATYMTTGAHEGWRVHGDWIRKAAPVFAPAIAARWKMASEVTDEACRDAETKHTAISAHVRKLMGDDAVAILPSAASLAPFRDADPAIVDGVRLRTMAITCIAGLAGLPQVSMPFVTPEGVPIGLSILGPPNSDLALVRLALEIRRRLGETGHSE
jgi:amidase